MVHLRRAGGLLVIAAMFPLAAWLGHGGHLASGVPTAAIGCGALGAAITWPMARDWIAWPAATVAVISLACTFYIISVGYDYLSASAAVTLGLVEMLGLLLFLALVTRWSSVRTALIVGPLVASAATLWILRFILVPSTDLLSLIGGCAVWSTASVAAVVAGGYPRFAATRLQQSVTAAREAQRLELAHDLHDFVAHDVTGIVAQAQAARFAASGDPVAMQAALERIAVIGQQALAAMDSMVDMLRDRTSDSLPLHAAGLAGLPDVVRRFRQERQAGCTVAFSPCGSDLLDLPPEIQLIACRVVVESLTNIRRHAPAAGRVTISLSVSPDGMLHVLVTNDFGPAAGLSIPRRAPGGKGLVGLADRVTALSGQFRAGPDQSGDWSVCCKLPTTVDERRR